MLRTLIGAAYITAWITLFSGCTMPTRSGDLLSRLRNTPDEEEELADARESRWAERSAENDGEIDSTLASYMDRNSRTDSGAQPESASRRESASAQQSPGLDAATLFLIESELRDAPAPERERWMAYLQTIDPKTVPYVLQARRMSVDASGGMPPGPQAIPGSPDQGERQPQVAASGMPRARAGAGGAMSQMQLNAPDPGASSMVITPAGGQQTPVSQEYVFNDNQSRTPQPGRTAAPGQTEAPGQTQGPLPRISPSPYGQASDVAMNDSAVMRTNFEPGDNLQNQPISSGQDAYLQEALQRVIALTEAEVAARDPGYTEQERMDYLKRQVALRMLYFMSEQPHLAQQAIPDVSQADQEFWTELFWAVSDYFDVASTPDPADRAALAAAQLESAGQQLQEQARLELWNTSFSHKITSFGNFERYDRDEFRAGQPVLLYAELKNFHSEPMNNGYFRTQLKSHIEIRRGGVDGQRIDYNSFDPTEDLCRAPRKDYFHSYKIELPHDLTPGPYALVLTVEDMLSGKVATEVLDFRIR